MWILKIWRNRIYNSTLHYIRTSNLKNLTIMLLFRFEMIGRSIIHRYTVMIIRNIMYEKNSHENYECFR